MDQRNGRIDLLSNDFVSYHTPEEESITGYSEALTGRTCHSNLSLAFFSKENVEIIHNAIRAGVYVMSNKKFVVGKQNINNIKIIMRSVFIQYARHKANITKEIECLNHIVIDYCVHNLYNNIIADEKYKHDVSHLAVPMDRPQHTSTRGDNTLEFNGFFKCN